jgi:predicted thioesterase
MKLEDLVPVGTTNEQTIEVTDELTVGFSVAGMPMVFATPQMIQHMEVVCAAAIGPLLPDGWISVGTMVEVQHLAATPVGFNVTTKCTVVEVSGPMVTFEVVAEDGVETVGKGRHVRAAVEFDRFIVGIERKEQQRP